MIKDYEVSRWLTQKQNISTKKGDLIDTLILNSIFRLNANSPLGDIEEEQLINKIIEARHQLEKDSDSNIDDVVSMVVYG